MAGNVERQVGTRLKNSNDFEPGSSNNNMI